MVQYRRVCVCRPVKAVEIDKLPPGKLVELFPALSKRRDVILIPQKGDVDGEVFPLQNLFKHEFL
jgi:hypothetical protein